MAKKLLTDLDRLIRRVEYVEDCWIYLGSKSKSGYGWFSIGSRTDKSAKTIQAHRMSYQLHKGDIPEGLVIDHLCRVRACINPDHLEAVTVLENVRRSLPYKPKTLTPKVFCKLGHSDWKLDKSSGKRYCHPCRKVYLREWQRKYRMRLQNAV